MATQAGGILGAESLLFQWELRKADGPLEHRAGPPSRTPGSLGPSFSGRGEEGCPGLWVGESESEELGGLEGGGIPGAESGRGSASQDRSPVRGERSRDVWRETSTRRGRLKRQFCALLTQSMGRQFMTIMNSERALPRTEHQANMLPSEERSCSAWASGAQVRVGPAASRGL